MHPTFNPRTRLPRACAAVLALAVALQTAAHAAEFDLEKIRAEAEKGDAGAQYTLGKAYAKGEGVPQDYPKAVEFYRRAAEQGNAEAQTNLGALFAQGQGVSQDEPAAVGWFRKAAEQGDAIAQQDLAWLLAHSKNPAVNAADALPWYQAAAAGGQREAQLQLGQWYFKGGHGLQQDYAEAAKWLGKAAVQGSAAAQNTLGVIYENGYGVERNEAEAVKYYRQAAAQGEARGQLNLGRTYLDGIGNTAKDPAKAYQWLTLSADQGEVAATKMRGDFEAMGTFSKEDIANGKRLAAEYTAQAQRTDEEGPKKAE